MAGQTSLASTLVTWHTTAAGVAANAMQSTAAGVTGCSLTPSAYSYSQCPVSPNLTSASINKALVTGTYTNPAGITVSPPSSLSSSIYQWSSVAFSPASGGYYVMTYITPSTNAQGTISTATNPATQLNVTMGDVYHQLRQLGIPSYSFGYVSSNGTLNVAPITINGVVTAVSYPLPTGITIPAGSLGIISSPGQCGSC